MVYDVRYGELTESRKLCWDNKEDNPYDVLKWHKKITAYDWINVLGTADKMLTDKIQIDWGSFAWKTNGKNLVQFVSAIGGTLEGRNQIDPNAEYGVVFIEES